MLVLNKYYNYAQTCFADVTKLSLEVDSSVEVAINFEFPCNDLHAWNRTR